MSSNRQIFLGGAGLTVLVAVMAWLFIWPGYRDARGFRVQVEILCGKIAGLEDGHREVGRLKEQVDEAGRLVGERCKEIPASPEVAELIRKLSLPVDGVSVTDQTFTAGSAEAIDASGLEGWTFWAMPLKVEMSATFESIYALLRAAESMNQLMRVSSLKVICKRDEKSSAPVAAPGADVSPMLNASVGLEAIYDPPADADGYEKEGR